MSRPSVLSALPLLAVLPTFTALPTFAAPPGAAEGRIEAGGAQVEVLGRPVAVGERIELPEGWFRVEEQGVEDRDVGSFTVEAAPSEASPASPAQAAAAEPPPAPEAMPPAPTGPPPQPACTAERSAYLKELWRMSGIDVDDPAALLRGLESSRWGASDAYVLALSADPVRPLAWSSALRARARELVRCVREQQ
jgi:hypothetical protein